MYMEYSISKLCKHLNGINAWFRIVKDRTATVTDFISWSSNTTSCSNAEVWCDKWCPGIVTHPTPLLTLTDSVETINGPCCRLTHNTEHSGILAVLLMKLVVHFIVVLNQHERCHDRRCINWVTVVSKSLMYNMSGNVPKFNLYVFWQGFVLTLMHPTIQQIYEKLVLKAVAQPWFTFTGEFTNLSW